MRPFGALVLAVGLAAASAFVPVVADAAPPAVSARDKEAARKLVAEGSDLEKQGDFAKALEKYRQAAELSVTAGLRFHIGYCLEMTGKLTLALAEYEAADKLATDTNKPEVRSAVASRIEPLRARVSHVSIRRPTQTTDVTFDGAPLSERARNGEAFDVDPGMHTVTASDAGFRPLQRTEHLSEGETKTLEIELVPLPRPEATKAPTVSAVVTPPPREAPRGHSKVGPILATTSTLLLAGGGVAAFMLAGDAQHDAQQTCPTKPSCSDERDEIRRLDTVALAGFASAAVLGVVSIVLWTRSDSSSDTASARTRLVASPTSIGLEGAF